MLSTKSAHPYSPENLRQNETSSFYAVVQLEILVHMINFTCMHGVHFQKSDSSLMIWMDMNENGKFAFETPYEPFRVNSTSTQEV